jgi:phosphatidate cytidylyltransferase
LVLIIGFGEPWHFSLTVFLVTVIGLYEYFLMVFPPSRPKQGLGILLGVVVSLRVFVREVPLIEFLLPVFLIGTFASYFFWGEDRRDRYRQLGWTLLGAFYIGYLIPHFALLFALPSGREWVIFVLLVVMAGDTSGYFVGTFLGKKKLAPRISPGKTVEGALGSIGASLLGGVVGSRILSVATPWPEAVLLSLLLSVLGQAGDLFESWIKRVFSVKDSGRLLPGHGGLLDRMDSLIFAVVFTTYYVRLVNS